MIDRTVLRARAKRAALAVTLALGMGGCFRAHDREERGDAGPRPDDAGRADAGRSDAGPPDAGLDAGDVDCVPDPDCNPTSEHPAEDGFCDWNAFNACCEARGWNIDTCQLPGGPLSPPEMPEPA
ncbi:MAG: hypothetical protein AB7S26_11745 [Sandaracinaceae bacterium]